MIVDTHSHSTLSMDGRSAPCEMAAAAVKRGIDVLAMTEHCDAMRSMELGSFWGIGGSIGHYNEDEAEKGFLAVREEYGDRIKLLYGLELGEPHFRPEECRALLARHDFDCVIGSVHVIGADTDVVPATRYSGNPLTVFGNYLADYTETVRLGITDVLGHLDYPLRYVSEQCDIERTFLPFREQIYELLRIAAEKGMALEINGRRMKTAGGKLSPEPWVVRSFRECGGELLTYGSDAHCADDLLAGHAEAVALAKSCGFTHMAYFEKRKPIAYAI